MDLFLLVFQSLAFIFVLIDDDFDGLSLREEGVEADTFF